MVPRRRRPADRGQQTRPAETARAPGPPAPGRPRPSRPDTGGPRLATRSAVGQLLRDVARQLDESLAVLAGVPSAAAATARARLEAAREAVSLAGAGARRRGG